MPQEGQKTITLPEDVIVSLEPIAKKNSRSVANIVKLCIDSHFGNADSKKQSKEVLERLIK